MAFWDRWRKRDEPMPQAQTPRGSASLSAAAAPCTTEDPYTQAQRLLAAGRATEALACYERAIDQSDTGAAGHVGQARAYEALGRMQDALDSLEIALAIEPRNVLALQLAGRWRSTCGQHADAVTLIERALESEQTCAALFTDYALALNAGGDPDAAAAAYEQALAIDPADPAPRINLGLLHLQHYGRFDAAERCFRRALEESRHHVAGFANLGLALQAQGRYDQALEVYREGLGKHPDHIELRWNRGLTNLAQGLFREGWQDYEARLLRDGRRRLDGLPLPRWLGQPLPQGRLLVHAEQGLGDEIMFASCLPDVLARVPRVLLECHPQLGALFTRSFPGVEVLARDREEGNAALAARVNADAMIPAGSLPGIFRPDATSFPIHRGYLRAERTRVDAWRHRLDMLGAGLKIGVSWRGGMAHTRRSLRSLPLDAFASVVGMSGTHWVSLQYGECAADIAAFHDRTGHIVHHWPEAIDDYDETAALVAALDVVLTVTTSLVHLTGALGKPALVLVPAFPEWRYLSAGERMPWYPNVRLVRQQSVGDWTSALQRASDALAQSRDGMQGQRLDHA